MCKQVVHSCPSSVIFDVKVYKESKRRLQYLDITNGPQTLNCAVHAFH